MLPPPIAEDTPTPAPTVRPTLRPSLSASPRSLPRASWIPVVVNADIPAGEVATAARPAPTVFNIPPAAARLAPPVGAAKRTAPAASTTLPMSLLTIFLTALPIELATLFTALRAFLSALLSLLYSRKPVTGLIDPAPPSDLRRAASCGLMCARIVSPSRPWACKNLAIGLRDTSPPSRNVCTSCPPSSVGIWLTTK